MPDLITRSTDWIMSIDDIRGITEKQLPFFCYCDGGSLFGWLIRKIDKSAASHLQGIVWKDGKVQIATQHIYFRLYPIEHLAPYNCKFIWNPEWTDEQRRILNNAINARLAMPWYKTLYDVPGVIGEALNIEWLQLKWFDFCSEAFARVLKLVDTVFAAWLKLNPTPTPKDFNRYTKQHDPPYKIYGRYLVDDAVEKLNAAIVESKAVTAAIKEVPAEVDTKADLVQASEKVTSDLKDAKQDVADRK